MTTVLTFRALGREDFPLLFRWLTTPHVKAWWREPPASVDDVEQEYAPVLDGRDATRVFVALADGVPFGLIQCYRHADEPDWDKTVRVPAAAGVDYLIGEPDHRGRGLGAAMIATFVPSVFACYPEVATVVAVPQADNLASRNALERAGFHLVEVRQLESDDPSDSGPSAIYAIDRPS
jgi:aminoglycoside 6'-N-acetyltransferase